jgi:hypothetical protein
VRVHIGAGKALGLVPADPRADHVVLLADGGGIGLLGLGSARRVDRARVEHGLDALAALRTEDARGFADAVVALGLLPADHAADAYPVVSDFAGEVVRGPYRLDADALAGLTHRALAELPGALPVAQRVTPLPADLWPVRMFGQLAAVLGRLGATEDWGALALEAGRGGWD